MNAWKLSIAIELAAYLASLEFGWSEPAAEAVGRLQRFVEENFGELRPNLITTATGLLKGLRSFHLGAFGFSAGAEREVPAEQPLTPAVIGAMLDTLTQPLKEVGVLVAFDRLDDSWDGSEEAQSLLIGLLKAGKDLNDKFGLNGDAGLRVTIFLRTDIYDSLRFDDKDKHRALEEHILWDVESLREMLSRRLPEGVETEELFEAGELRGRIAPFNYIVKRTFLRPREILQYVGLCLHEAGPDATEVPKEAIRAAEGQYSAWKVEDLTQEMRRVAPSFPELLEALRQEVHRYDSIEDLSELLNRKAPEAVGGVGGPRHAMQVLFDASVIGIRLRGAGSTRFKSEDPQLRLPAEGAVYVHQGLYNGLNIAEARKPAEEPTDEDEAIAE